MGGSFPPTLWRPVRKAARERKITVGAMLALCVTEYFLQRDQETT